MTTAEALEVRSAEPLTAQEMRLRVNRMQEVMTAVMKEGVHYGKIPGTDKPTLYKAGAEVALVTFRIAAMVKQTEDIGTLGEEVRYRVIVQGVHQVTGDVLGEGAGECSSSEEKYKWRRPVHEKEYLAADPERRRVKYARNGEEWKQVRTEPADVANTILKMAVKRALVAMTLVVTAASDVFAQDIEDLPEELRETVGSDTTRKAPVQQPQRNSEKKPEGSAAKPPATSSTAPQQSAATTVATIDPAAAYTLRKIWQPNANKPYRFMELADAKGAIFTVHTWDKKIIELLEGKSGVQVRLSGKESNFEAAPYQVQKAELVEREPGAEG